MNESALTYQELIATLPPSLGPPLENQIRQLIQDRACTIIVLDDDPTGTQTVYDIPILTNWREETIEAELIRQTPIFFILTNSRSMTSQAAEVVAREIGQRIRTLGSRHQKNCIVVSRSDSTLRGHYPAEVSALEAGMAVEDGIHFLIPAFFEGGRYTIGDTHYVREGDRMIPAAETSFASDTVFGYESSNLTEWIEEKTGGKVASHQIHGISLEQIREQALDDLVKYIENMQPGDVCFGNAVSYRDLQILVLAILRSNIRPIFRTAASFVAALAAQEPRALLFPTELLGKNPQHGGLIVVGSYVSRSTQQLEHLLTNTQIHAIEVDVEKLLRGQLGTASDISQQLDALLRAGKHVVVYTSRKLIATTTEQENLSIGKKVSDFLSAIVAVLKVRPAYILAKGGITSSETATKSLQVQRSIVIGQILPGVPVWKLGEESKFPGLSYIVFPGNVGQANSLSEVVNQLSTHLHT